MSTSQVRQDTPSRVDAQAFASGTQLIQRSSNRLHQNEADRKRRFNRTENVRPIPPSDPDFPHLYGRRNDSESLNRSLEDTLFLGRAHSLGGRRQQVEMLGWAVTVNTLTMARHRASGDLEAAA
jgi:hypothetical protein